jgi:hypothetical protein
MKDNLGFIIFFIALIFFYLGNIIIMKSVFIYGDYSAQFYPWTKFYAESIKNFNFPFWCRYFQSGFPLIAEGQVGGFYPLNLLIYFLLPFHIGYNYSVVLHFILAGVFTYIYSRKLGADAWGGSLSALLFCFGSAYAGCFYNLITVRTLVWFPLVLYLFEDYFEKKRPVYLFLAGIIFGMQLLAGFLQVAAYSGFFYIIYFIYKMGQSKPKKITPYVFRFLIFLIPAAIIYLPQFLLSYQLMLYSTRSDVTIDFALWGSFSPLGFFSLLFPYWNTMDSQLYISILALIFVIFSMCSLRDNHRLRVMFLILIVSVCLALGKFNPLYVLALKITRLYSFRNPSKFLFFAVFAASIMAGWGFSHFFKKEQITRRRLSIRIFYVFLGVFISSFFAIRVFLLLFRSQLIVFGNRYVERFIYNTSYHRHSLPYYLAKVEGIYNSFLERGSFSNFYIQASWFFIIVAVVFIIFLYKQKALKWEALLKAGVIAVIFWDLFIYSDYGTGFKGNIRPFSYLEPKNPQILNILKNDKELFRILPYDIRSGKLPNWSIPEANITYGIDSIAVYTPLASKDYRDRLLDLEIVDDTLGLNNPKPNSIRDNLETLRLLNVKYIVSAQEFDYNFLTKVKEDKGIYLYQLHNYLSRLFFTKDIAGERLDEAAVRLTINEYRSGYVSFDIDTPEDGIIVFSEYYYPGWQAIIDGKRKQILKYRGLLQAVSLGKGRHKGYFIYKPFRAK